MITKEVIKKLPSKSNIDLSVDNELTKLRFSEDYKASTNTQKNDAILLSNISEAVFNSICRNGMIKIRPLAAFSYIAGVSPYWYTANRKEPYTDRLMWGFFCDNDLLYLVRQFKPESVADPELPEKIKEAAMAELTQEKALMLMESLYIQSPHSPKARERLVKILKILAWID